tara:strand:- start:220 stop:618 length:399 start_codon:yes stop_codon:yes gene_type:complete
MTVTWKEALTDKQLARKNELKLLRAQERKRLKHRYKREMGCYVKDCNFKIVKKTQWFYKFLPVEQQMQSFKQQFPNGITQKQLLNLSKAKFTKFFKEHGLCVCPKHLKEFKHRRDIENTLYGIFEDEREGDA